MDQPVGDRRADARFPPLRSEVTRATLRPGCAVLLVDLSAGGALVQALRPLRPGARVLLQLVTRERTFSLAAHVLRCAVWSLDTHDGATYRGALKFEDRCEWFWEPETRVGSAIPYRANSDRGLPGHLLPGRDDPALSRSPRSAK